MITMENHMEMAVNLEEVFLTHSRLLLWILKNNPIQIEIYYFSNHNVKTAATVTVQINRINFQ